MLRQLRARISKLQAGLDELLAETETHPIPSISFADILTGILEHPEEKTRRQKIGDLKTFARAIAFAQVNGIADLDGLRDKVVDMYSQQHGINDKLKKVEHRLKTLADHIRHADNFFEHRALHKQYKQVKPQHQANFYEANRTGLTLYEAAQRYLKPVLNGCTKIPRQAWKDEAAQLVTEKQALYAEYTGLKEEVKDIEIIRRCVETVLRDEPQVKQGRMQGMEL